MKYILWIHDTDGICNYQKCTINETNFEFIQVCKRCGVIGHFVDVHDVEDAEFRKLIVQTLEVDVFGTTPVDVNAPLEAPQPAPMPNMDSWYQ